MQLFISYARPDRPRAESLTLRLRQAGITVWLDSDLLGGQAWWDRILDQLRTCDAVVVVISAAAIKSHACRSERQYAMELGKPILPLTVEPMRTEMLPADIAGRPVIDYSQPSEDAAFELIGAIRALPSPGELPYPLPTAPAVPTSPFGSLVDRLAEPALSLKDQLDIIARLGAALGPAADPHDAPIALELLRQMDERPDLLATAAREIEKIRAQLNVGPPPGQSPPAASGPRKRVRDTSRGSRVAAPPNRTARGKQDKGARTAVISISRQMGDLQAKLNAWLVLIDGEKVGRIWEGQRREYHVPPGTHQIQIRINTHSRFTSPVEVLTLNDGDRAGFLCGLDHPLAMRDALSAAAWKDQLTAPKDSFIRLSRE